MINIILATALNSILDFSDINPVNVALFILFVLLAFGLSWLARYYQERGTRIIYNRHIFYYLSGALVLFLLLGVGYKAVRGDIRLGIDFRGGTLIQVGFKESISEAQIRDALKEVSQELNRADLSNALIQEVKLANVKGYSKLYIIRLEPLDSQREVPKVKEALQRLSGEVLKVESVGPTMSKEIRRNAILALLVALAAQVLYIALRFGYNIFYGLIADLALIHDVIVMVGIYILLGKEIDSPFVAALLTVIGYSVMDSIVIFDRIRENLRRVTNAGRQKDFDFERLVNDSVNQTITRSVNTAISSLLPLIGIYFLGGQTLKNFAFAISVGFISGAYSSIFLAAPLVVSLKSYIIPAELRRLEEERALEEQRKMMEAAEAATHIAMSGMSVQEESSTSSTSQEDAKPKAKKRKIRRKLRPKRRR